jgi:hypothetical protein
MSWCSNVNKRYAWPMRSPRKADTRKPLLVVEPGNSVRRWGGNKEVCDKMFVAVMKTTAEIRVGPGG